MFPRLQFIVATHPDILRCLLNDLLERSDEAEMPADLPPGPYRKALEFADEATFSEEERDAYQKVIDEIQQVRELAEAKWADGKAEGKVEGKVEGNLEGEIKARRHTLLRLLVRAGIALTDEDRTRIQGCTDTVILDRWLDNVIGTKTVTDVLT
jgi:alpha-amylase/alpha-mannosidase (GH57 family)